MKICIVHPMPFPDGFASTIRIIAYSKGLIQSGGRVHVLCLKPREEKGNEKNIHVKGENEGISYEYTSGTVIRHPNIFIRYIHNLKGTLFAILKIIQQKRREHLQTVIIVGPLGFVKEVIFCIVCRLYSIKIFQERSEYPFLTSRPSIPFKIELWLYLHLGCKLYHGMIFISDVLSQYFAKYLNRYARRFVLPILVDHSRFSVDNPKDERNYVAYCGSMEGKKDGMIDLLKAFSFVVKKHPDLYLYLIGRTDFSGFNQLERQISELNIQDRVVFTGRVSNEQMPVLLAGAKVLLLARPSTIQAQANFPTKIGEYLATGRPLLMTNVGIVPHYFKDGINAFLSEPSAPFAFAEKLNHILENYGEAMRVGIEGKKLAEAEFNYRLQGKRLFEFLSEF